MSVRKQGFNMSVQYSLHTKIAFNINLVGKKNAGKSSLVVREIKDTFGTVRKASQGFEFYSKTKKLKNQQVSIQIWDTAAQSQYNSMTRNFFRTASAIILVYDKIDNLEKQISELKSEINQYASQYVKFCLIRTKIDVNPVTPQQSQKLKDLLQITFPNEIFYHGEVSAKTGQNVNKYFSQLIDLMFKSYEEEQGFRETVSPVKNSFYLNSVQNDSALQKRKKKCC